MIAALNRLKIMDHLRSGGWYFAAGLVGGLLSYLYQVVASRELSSADFAALNGWFANFAIYFFLGGIFQYGAVFKPTSGRPLAVRLFAINVMLLLFVWWWFSGTETFGVARAIIVVVSTASAGWIMGQLQARLAFTLLAFLGLIQATVKLMPIFFPAFPSLRVEAYALACFVTLLPTHWIASYVLLRSDKPTTTTEGARSGKDWIAPILLSCAVALMPQYDLVLMDHTQTRPLFEEFARASLFYKGIYFVFFIVAQWLLPQQIQRTAEIRNLGVAVVFALVSSIVITLAAPFVGRIVLHWDHDPSAWLILGSCIHMSLLTLTFLGIQQACADGRVWVAAVVLGLIVVKGAMQFALGLEASTYLIYAIVLQLPILWVLFGRAGSRPMTRAS